MIEVEQPKSWKEHQDNIDPSLFKRGKAEEKLADNLICNENNLTLRGSTSRKVLRSHSRFEESHCYDSRDKDED